MTTRKRGPNRGGKPKFRVVARGYPRTQRDISLLQRASVEYFLAEQEKRAEAERNRFASAHPDTDTTDGGIPDGE